MQSTDHFVWLLTGCFCFFSTSFLKLTRIYTSHTPPYRGKEDLLTPSKAANDSEGLNKFSVSELQRNDDDSNDDDDDGLMMIKMMMRS